MSGTASTTGPQSLDDDLAPLFTPRQALAESSRCLFCYDAPCVRACPTGIDIPGFIRRIANEHPKGAAHTILEANIFGGTCARVCPTEVLCEAGLRAQWRRAAARRHRPAAALRHRHAAGRQGRAASVRARGRHRQARRRGRRRAGGARPAPIASPCSATRSRSSRPRTRPAASTNTASPPTRWSTTSPASEAKFILGIGGIKVHYGKALGRR